MTRDNQFAEYCRRVCEAQGWELLPTGINVRFGDGRHQLVSLELFELGREMLVRLSSGIGDVAALSREQLESALQHNAELAHGALAIRGAELCMTDTLMVEATGPAEIEAAVEYLANLADVYENTFFGTDVH
ncbi:MAG: hypothetical protein JRG92_02515 [Deltaproteobacteria bacterium]|nr:hypothetical protein [Deltaproteobacteria bacterium]MBW2382475.1 hypothetical protein [Deltaproteobacteria bacterium]MBW2697992.1 hypothetical protein [Deltaproteobacteria bacterium]